MLHAISCQTLSSLGMETWPTFPFSWTSMFRKRECSRSHIIKDTPSSCSHSRFENGDGNMAVMVKPKSTFQNVDLKTCGIKIPSLCFLTKSSPDKFMLQNKMFLVLTKSSPIWVWASYKSEGTSYSWVNQQGDFGPQPSYSPVLFFLFLLVWLTVNPHSLPDRTFIIFSLIASSMQATVPWFHLTMPQEWAGDDVIS